MTECKLFYTMFLFYFSVCFASSSSFSSNHKCSQEQTHDLLLFKQSLSSINSSYEDPYGFIPCDDFLGSGYYPIMMNWSINTDCCYWDGITCDHFTGDVTAIDLRCGMLQGIIHPNSTLFHLPHLQTLNLAYNDFTGSHIPHEIRRLSNSLTHLNITSSGLEGQIPLEISLLSRLVCLDLSYNDGLTIQPSVFNSLLQNSTHLRELLLSGDNISSVLPTSFKNSSTLKTLVLSFNNLVGKLPDNIFSLPCLEKLDLSWNDGLTGTFPDLNTSTNIPLKLLGLSSIRLYGKIPDLIGNLKFLNFLGLSHTQLSGKIPDSIGNLKFLNHLNLHNTSVYGKIPDSIGNLKFLNLLHLSYTQLSGEIPDSIGNLTFLNSLQLSSSRLSGKIPDSIGNLKFLTFLHLSDMQLYGKIPDSIGNLTFLNSLNLQYTQLSGKIPDSIGSLRSLNRLNIKYCNLSGSLPRSLSNLTHLSVIDLSYNKLSGTLPSFLFTLPLLEFLWLDNNMFRGGLPMLSNYSALNLLDLSYNQFDGKISQSFIKLVNLTNIDLQHKKFIGSWELYTLLSSLPSLVELCLSHSGLSVVASNMTRYVNKEIELLYLASCNLNMFLWSLQGMENLKGLDLSGNYIQGHIPNWVGEMKLSLLDLSDNSITRLPQFQWDGLEYLLLHSNQIEGRFPSPICNMSFLRYLDMSNNHFGGMIPQCIGNILSNLEVINLSNNSFHGTIPNGNTEYCYLDWLILSGNHFEGDVASFLSKCHDLKVLDIGNNYLNGTFPRWFGNLSNLEVLILNSNSLHALIETSFKVEKPFSSLQILDLSHNGFVGHLPQKFFQNFHAMKDVVIDSREPEYLRSQIRGLPMYYSLTIGVKGHELLFSKVNDHYTIVDLSNNKFVGGYSNGHR